MLKLLPVLFTLAWTGGSASAANAAEIHLVAARGGQIENLTIDEAEQLYLGRKTTLSNGTPVKLVDLPAGTARDRLYLLLTGKNPIQTRAYWSRQVFTGRALPPREAESQQQARDWLATTPDAIGYLPADVTDSRLRILLRLP
ncbi:MAG: hypothetical protein CVU19_13245 [Betaproteobacteria bacterium HGW-Betaproteobacteria-13]|uniref:Phosphate ABC transporter substrate-binding protein n=1 Tax=Parazoarcus communis TaxID=41977 RepID=A0A2U8HBA8_9RHOO|nr:hypothetical protein CEW87_09920 [Parazoarcus communis]PKO58878.1 MAG: hypothetical protein CVU25_03505 [Betaproteobacteria bacterium HGW-Betaproteobacteria-19]PKO80284.1 MAG: hypothetical protein CVU19_13245 [Betaproteobacteria bacterium HGW-Betaproteobacteria-13]